MQYTRQTIPSAKDMKYLTTFDTTTAKIGHKLAPKVLHQDGVQVCANSHPIFSYSFLAKKRDK